MRAFTKRAIALTTVGVAASAAFAVSAGAASAAATGGTITLTINNSYIAHLASAGVVILPQDDASVSYDNTAGTVSITYTVTGGDGSLDNFAGAVDASGSLLGFSIDHGLHVAELGGLNLNVLFDTFDATPTGGSDTALLDLNGNIDRRPQPVAVGRPVDRRRGRRRPAQRGSAHQDLHRRPEHRQSQRRLDRRLTGTST
jgi:hypothetical protein